MYALPQGVILAVLIGFPLGAFLGVGGRIVSGRSAGAILALAVASTALSITMFTSLLPAANRAARESESRSADRDVTARQNELTFSELREQRDSATRQGRQEYARSLDVYYHTRWALSFAPLAFILLALSVVVWRPIPQSIMGMAFCGISQPITYCRASEWSWTWREAAGSSGSLAAEPCADRDPRSSSRLRALRAFVVHRARCRNIRSFVLRFSFPLSVIEPSHRHRALLVIFYFHHHFHRLTADRAVFDVLLRGSAAWIHIELQRLTAVRAFDGDFQRSIPCVTFVSSSSFVIDRRYRPVVTASRSSRCSASHRATASTGCDFRAE